MDRVLFARELVEFIQAEREVWFFDETSFFLWDTMRRTWQHKDKSKKLAVYHPSERGRNFTVLGAISSKRDLCVRQIGNSTNNDTVAYFWGKFLENTSLQGSVIVWDNHRSHWNPDIRKALICAGAYLLFLPASSSFMNPIELLWGWLKKKWRTSTFMLGGVKPTEE